MTEQQHPITPPPELVQQIRSDALHGSDGQLDYELRMIHAAFRSGADQELEACCKALKDIWYNDDVVTQGDFLRALSAARRPKPPSLTEHGLKILDGSLGLLSDEYPMEVATIRRAIERLQELESKQ